MREAKAARSRQDGGPAHGRLGWLLAGAGIGGLVVAALVEPSAARSAASQDWPPFVLVAGLLLIGLVADDDGLFAAAGRLLARVAPSGAVLFAGAAVVVGGVTAVLNLDTSVAFLTPVLVYTARNRGEDDSPLLYGCLLLSNAGSLFLPGSNLTNLIVLGHLHLTGGQFLARMWAPALSALVVTALVVAGAERHHLLVRREPPAAPVQPRLGLGIVAVGTAIGLVIALPSPALPVAAVGVAVAGSRLLGGSRRLVDVVRSLGLPVLVGLFGVAVALGVLGRTWSGPATLLSHVDAWGTAAVAAIASVAVNNLPAASLFAARVPPHPFALLVGLNLGPNLFVTGSLAWFLWLRAARAAGSRPSIPRASLLGFVAVPLSVLVALSLLQLTMGSS